MKNIGIAGAGQLGLYLAKEAIALGYEVTLLAQKQDDPAALAFPDSVELWDGRIPSQEWLKSCDYIVFENEYLNWEYWNSAQNELKSNVAPTCLPSIQAMQVASDKFEQKKIFSQCGIQTADFEEVIGLKRPKLKAPYFLKWARGGYDGRGVLKVKNSADFEASDVADFLKAAEKSGVRVYAESAINFSKEVALVSVRDKNGGIACYPLVETVQEAGICQWVIPLDKVNSESDKITTDNGALNTAAKAVAGKLGESLKLVGVFAIEFFVTPNGLIANELAPRVHNSGHWSLSGAMESQFRIHLRAVMGDLVSKMKLQNRDDRPVCGMRNLVVPVQASELEIEIEQTFTLNSWANSAAVKSKTELFWYGKSKKFAGRKMGHLNFWSKNREEFEGLRELIAKDLKSEWG